MIDWDELSRVDIKTSCEFAAERFDNYLTQMYREIVIDPDRDNEEIKSIWLSMCDGNFLMKADFLSFVIQTREKGDHRPIDHKDVLRYFNHRSFTELKEAEQIKVHSSKYS